MVSTVFCFHWAREWPETVATGRDFKCFKCQQSTYTQYLSKLFLLKWKKKKVFSTQWRWGEVIMVDQRLITCSYAEFTWVISPLQQMLWLIKKMCIQLTVHFTNHCRLIVQNWSLVSRWTNNGRESNWPNMYPQKRIHLNSCPLGHSWGPLPTKQRQPFGQWVVMKPPLHKSWLALMSPT